MLIKNYKRKFSVGSFSSAFLISSILFSACQKNMKPSEGDGASTQSRNAKVGNGMGNLSPQVVVQWNEAATYVVQQTQAQIANPPIPPFIESRYYAMVNIAMHDALNSIIPKYQTYALNNVKEKAADPNAAVAKAAHDVISFFFGKLNPPAGITPTAVQAYIQNLLVQSLASVPNSEAKTKGIQLGTLAAEAIIQNRNNDGIGQVMYPVSAGGQPGQYRFHFPFTVPPFNLPPPFTGFYDSPGWGNVKTFGLESNSQFTVSGPYAVNSSEYAQDYNEVKNLGCVSCTGTNGRTVDQENVARFWVESSPYGWNKIARQIISQRNLDAWRVARLFALLQIAEADAYISCLKAKMTHFFWRPVSAIHEGNIDGNPNTSGDSNWEVLVFPTPPVADYPSAHATAGGAAAELLKMFFGKDEFNFSFESSSLQGQSRTFTSLSQAARENSLSRIYVGYHFKKACLDGESLGKNVGGYIVSNLLQEN